MTTRVVAMLLLVLVAACSDGDEPAIGSIEDFCADSEAVVDTLAELSRRADATPDELASVADDLRRVRAPADLRTDLDRVADVIDEVLSGFDGADLSDPEVLADVQDRLTALEAEGGELQAASARIAAARAAC